MPRQKLPPDYDTGFLRLHRDGSVTASFRINHLSTFKPPVHCRLDYRRGTLSIQWANTTTAGPPLMPDGDPDAFLPDVRSRTCVCFSNTLEHATAANTTTGFRLLRYDGHSLLQAWRSRRQRFFFHDGVTWIETESLDAVVLMQNSQKDVDHDEIPF